MTPIITVALITVMSVLVNGYVFAIFRSARLPEWLPPPYPEVVAMPVLASVDEWRGLV